jgi:hypothetical protein
MKRSSRPRKTADLSESVHQQLNMYVLAASAAGVGLLALAQSAEAKIVYTKTHVVIGTNHVYALDLNHDGVVDFKIDSPDNRFLFQRLKRGLRAAVSHACECPLGFRAETQSQHQQLTTLGV